MLRHTLLAALMLLAAVSAASAGAVTGDISVDSQAGTVLTYAEGANTSAATNAHSVDIRDGSQTGDITIVGRVDEISTIAVGNNVHAETNVGNVRIGN